MSRVQLALNVPDIDTAVEFYSRLFATPPNKRKQSDVDTYNKAIDDYNKAVNHFNKTNESLNTNRAKVINNWETTRRKFMDVHVPYKL